MMSVRVRPQIELVRHKVRPNLEIIIYSAWRHGAVCQIFQLHTFELFMYLGKLQTSIFKLI